MSRLSTGSTARGGFDARTRRAGSIHPGRVCSIVSCGLRGGVSEIPRNAERRIFARDGIEGRSGILRRQLQALSEGTKSRATSARAHVHSRPLSPNLSGVPIAPCGSWLSFRPLKVSGGRNRRLALPRCAGKAPVAVPFGAGIRGEGKVRDWSAVGLSRVERRSPFLIERPRMACPGVERQPVLGPQRTIAARRKFGWPVQPAARPITPPRRIPPVPARPALRSRPPHRPRPR